MIGHALSLWAGAALGQGLPVSLFDDGAIAGRVCVDADRDGRCGAEEAGLPGAALVLETGLSTRTDAAGRFHLAAVTGRAPDALEGGRLLPGRHRVKVDRRLLPAGAQVFPEGATVEVPMGALVVVDFAVRLGERAAAPVEVDAAAPRLTSAGHTVLFELRLTAPEDTELRLLGQPMARAGGAATATVALREGHQTVVATAATPDGVVALVARDFDVVRRPDSVLVIPRALRRVGRLHLPIDRKLGARVELPAGSSLAIDGVPVSLSEGQGLAPLVRDSFTARVEVPGVPPWEQPLSLPRLRGVFASGLLDAELAYAPAAGRLRLFGRGAGVVRAAWDAWSLSAELDLRDSDLKAPPSALLAERRPAVFQREVDPLAQPTSWADLSATVATNASDGRFRLELAREGLGRLRWGSVRASWSDTEVGRFHRALQGAALEVHTPAGVALGARATAFLAPGVADPLGGFGRRPAHDRFQATGGSVFFLSQGEVVQGSDFVRVEIRDAVTGLPLRERHLTRGQDYALDAAAGRILLARPLSFLGADPGLTSEPLTATSTQELVVDYEVLELAAGAPLTAGGELEGRLGPVTIGAGYARDGDYGLLRGRASAAFRGLRFDAEVARSAGAVSSLAWSQDGGLDWQVRPAGPAGGSGLAATVRARGPGLFGRGAFDVAWRWRQQGFEDLGGVGALRQLSARAEQPLGPVVVFLDGDLRDGVDPHQPFGTTVVKARRLGGGVGYEGERFGVRLEVRDAQLGVDPGDGLVEGGRLAVGVSGRYRVTPWLTVRAGHRQSVWRRGAGAGAWDDTFASVGADVAVERGPMLGLRGGWGPRLGPQVWGQVQYSRGEETWYGAQTLDVDGPSAGSRRFASGARQDIAPGTAVFVEDVAAHDVDALRLGRAVGLMQKISDALTLSARYERGVRLLGDTAPEVARDSGGAGVAWETARVRLGARAEARLERGAGGALTQWVGSALADATLTSSLSASGRLTFVHSSRDGLLVSRTVDAVASLAWRAGPVTVIGRYALVQERAPPGRGLSERRLQVVSLLPAVRVGDRFALSAGGHLGLTPEGLVLSASLRPSVRVVAGLEVAAEVARRSSAPDGGELTAVRGELGYRFDHRFFVGLGYTAFGFSGTGLEAGAAGSSDRLSLRAEAAY